MRRFFSDMKDKTLKLPVIVEADDYHDFDYVVRLLKQFGVKLKFHEIGCAGLYYAVFYEGKKPSNATLEKLLVKDHEFDKKVVKHFVEFGDTDLSE